MSRQSIPLALLSNAGFLVIVVRRRPTNRALDGAHPLLESLVSLSCGHRRSERPLCGSHIGQSGVVGPCRSVPTCQESLVGTAKSDCDVPDQTPTASPAAIAEPRAVVSTIAGRTTSYPTESLSGQVSLRLCLMSGPPAGAYHP